MAGQLRCPASARPAWRVDRSPVNSALGGHRVRKFVAICLSLSLAACAGHLHHGTDTCDAAPTAQATRACLDRELASLARVLTVALDSARARTSHPTAVDSAQAAWRAYRQAECAAAGHEFGGGTLEPIAVLDCWQK